MTSSSADHICKDPISESGHNHRSWGEDAASTSGHTGQRDCAGKTRLPLARTSVALGVSQFAWLRTGPRPCLLGSVCPLTPAVETRVLWWGPHCSFTPGCWDFCGEIVTHCVHSAMGRVRCHRAGSCRALQNNAVRLAAAGASATLRCPPAFQAIP